MINILTVFGNIVVYFKLPDWVQDFDKSLIENEDDFPSIKALKRFLSGDDEYRKKVLKVMPGKNRMESILLLVLRLEFALTASLFSLFV